MPENVSSDDPHGFYRWSFYEPERPVRVWRIRGMSEPMAENIIVTRTVAGMLGAHMEGEPTVSDKYPAWRFHPTLPPVTVQDEEEEKALPEGYRATVWEEADAEAWTAQHASHAEGGTARSRR